MTPGTSTYALIDCVRALRLLARIVQDEPPPDGPIQWHTRVETIRGGAGGDVTGGFLSLDSEIRLTVAELELVERMRVGDLEVEPRPLRFENDAQVDATLDLIAEALADAEHEPDA